MDTNTILYLILGLFFMLMAIGTWIAIRLVRAGAPPSRPSQYPTWRAPAIPSEFTVGKWKKLS